MNAKIYKNLLEPDSVTKGNKDYCFTIIPTDKCELLSYTSDDIRELEHLDAAVDEKSIICNKFTECLTMSMVARLSNQLHIDEEELRSTSSKDDNQEVWMVECLVSGGRRFIGKLCTKFKYGTFSPAIGLFFPCANFGVLGATCNYSNQRRYRNLKILCNTPSIASVYTCEDECHNELWYNEIQRSLTIVEDET